MSAKQDFDRPGDALILALLESVRRLPEEMAAAVRRDGPTPRGGARGRRDAPPEAEARPEVAGLLPGRVAAAGERRWQRMKERLRSFSVATPKDRSRDLYGASQGLLGSLAGLAPESGLGHWAAMMGQLRNLADSLAAFRRTWQASGAAPGPEREPARVVPPPPAPPAAAPLPPRAALPGPGDGGDEVRGPGWVLRRRPRPPAPPPPGARALPGPSPWALPDPLLLPGPRHAGAAGAPAAGPATGAGPGRLALPAVPSPASPLAAEGQGLGAQVFQLWQEILREQRALRAALEKVLQGREDEIAENDRGRGAAGTSPWKVEPDGPTAASATPSSPSPQGGDGKPADDTGTTVKMLEAARTAAKLFKWAKALGT